MRVTLSPPNAEDEFYLIKVDELMALVDSQDLALLNSEVIEDAYHEHWFIQCQDQSYQFHAPVIYVTKGVVKFINGRHRTLLLGRHMKMIPIALANIDGSPPLAKKYRPESVEAFSKISENKLTGTEVFDFPDLPLKYLGYDDNIGK